MRITARSHYGCDRCDQVVSRKYVENMASAGIPWVYQKCPQCGGQIDKLRQEYGEKEAGRNAFPGKSANRCSGRSKS